MRRPSHDGVTLISSLRDNPDEEAIENAEGLEDGASQRQESGPVVDLRDDLDDYTVVSRRSSKTSTPRPS